MANGGLFTYRTLYGGKPELYHREIYFDWSLSTVEQFVSSWDDTTTTTTTSIDFVSTVPEIVELIPFDTLESNATHGELHSLVRAVPFTYFHWFLVGLAIILTLVLTVVYVCYCRGHCINNKGKSRKKKEPTPSIYRYRSVNKRIHGCDMYDSSVPLTYPSPVRPCPPKSVERLNRLLRQGLDAVGSPQKTRTNNVSQPEPTSTFTNTASNMLNEIKTRLSTHSSEPAAAKVEKSYETQNANLTLTDETTKEQSALIDLN